VRDVIRRTVCRSGALAFLQRAGSTSGNRPDMFGVEVLRRGRSRLEKWLRRRSTAARKLTPSAETMLASFAVEARAFTAIFDGSPFEPDSPQAAAIASLFRSTLFVCGAVFVLVTVLVMVCVVRFRADGVRVPAPIEGHTGLEIGWTIAPVVVLIGLLYLTVRAMNASDPPVDRDPDVTVIGHQWWWEARYPSGAVTANEIHVPTGSPLVFRLESADVIHDFWVPELGRKMDATPGRPTTLWLQADHPGTFLGTCAEYCGAEHAWMRIVVVAEPPEKFAEWQRHQLAPAATPIDAVASRGEALFRSMTCVDCHRVGGTGGEARFAPDLTHVAERSTLGAGVLANNPTDLGRWLKDPQAIKAGCHMPDAQLTDSQVADLAFYLETLQ
jgi:cytochrome c oxidase subunit 2